MTWSAFIENLRAEFLGEKIMYQDRIYNITKVDLNGVVYIDMPSPYYPDTAVYDYAEARKHLVKEVKL